MRVVTLGLPLLALLASAGCHRHRPAHSEPFVQSLPPAPPPEPEPAAQPVEQAPPPGEPPPVTSTTTATSTATASATTTNEVSATVNGTAVATAEPTAAPAAQGAPQGDEADQYAETDASATTEFRETLAPHGRWVEDPTYGTVWVPARETVGADFTPYGTSGHWAYDSGGNYVWASDYPWGWATFHYGRWAYVDGGGWAWIPGRRYAASWVTWRTGDAYVGWAPMGPSYYWRGGRVQYVTGTPVVRYSYVETRYLFHSHVSVNFVPAARVTVVAASTRPYMATSVQGRVVAGPPPSTLRIPATAIVRAPANDVGVAKAQAFARPSAAKTATTARVPQTGTTAAAAPARPTMAPQPAPSHAAIQNNARPTANPAPVAQPPRQTTPVAQPPRQTAPVQRQTQSAPVQRQQPAPAPQPQPRYVPAPQPHTAPPAPQPHHAPASGGGDHRHR